MAIRNRDELMQSIQSIVGDSTEENVINFLEDVTDTLNDYDERLKDETEWKAKYEENDANWKKKYKERFFGNTEQEKEIKEEIEKQEEKEKDIKTFEDLFKQD